MDAQLRSSILDFWFNNGASAAENVKHRWFLAAGTAEQAAFDVVVCERFATQLELALTGAYDASAMLEPRAALALIILLDQFSRHIFRHEPQRLVPCDERAAMLARRALAVSGLRRVGCPSLMRRDLQLKLDAALRTVRVCVPYHAAASRR